MTPADLLTATNLKAFQLTDSYDKKIGIPRGN